MVDKNEKFRRWATKYAKEALLKRSKGICERCKKNFAEMIHHIRYKKDIDCLLYVCGHCHNEIHELQDEKNFLKKLVKHLDMYADNEEIKVIKEKTRVKLLSLGLDKDVPE
jgi:DNA-directed RNA polymerase subunit RPC12/RpoP